jgi:excinuclease ABC subunit A
LNRNSSTLSGGELQRIRLATQIGARLSGVMYVLDEPSRGLHQRDNARLIDALIKLKNLGNTVIVVEHDEETMRAADQIIDVGPGAGQLGGTILCSGNFHEILKSRNSYTADYLSGRKKIQIPDIRRTPGSHWFKIFGAQGNNLKKIDFKMPVARFVCVTGVSGSGKSSLINGVVAKAIKLSKKKTFTDDQISLASNLNYSSVEGFEYFENLISVNQKPIGKTPRSNPATYLGLFNYIREIFASCRMSKERGYSLSRFSFNLKGGRCESCQGDGSTRIEMHFLPDVFVECDVCKGQRFSRETLEIRWRGKNIFEVLSMTVEEAYKFFYSNSIIEKKLKALVDVGLHYIKLGQSSTTLSGGEAQRIKLANELSKRSTGNTLYILDEPTTGLHFYDIAILLKALVKLRDSGNSILVIEHNLDVIKTADWIIDMGPEGGDKGGEIIAEGPPEEIAKTDKSHTGLYLKKILL